jgi:hypothetical protein
MKKVYTQDEADKLLKQNKQQWLISCTESYVVRFRYQQPDGFWTTNEVMYHTSSKDAHQSVENKWRKQYPHAELINIIYQ